jgi:hypothetical protein
MWIYLKNNWVLFILTITLLTWRIWWAHNNASRWQMGFNSAFRVLKMSGFRGSLCISNFLHSSSLGLKPLVMLGRLCCFHLVYSFRSFSVELIFLLGGGGVGFLAPRLPPKLVVVGPSPTLLPPRSNGKTRSCYCSCWVPDDGRENARNMLSCT